MPITIGCGDSKGEWDRCFWFSLGIFSGLSVRELLLLVDDGVPLEMALGGGGCGAGLELLILLFLESLQAVHLLFSIYLLMFLGF